MTILQLRTFKTQIMTNTRNLAHHFLQGSVPERTKHQALYILTYCEKSSNPIKISKLCMKLNVS